MALEGAKPSRRDPRGTGKKLKDWFLARPGPTGEPLVNTPDLEPAEGRTGICCSGGGVRSAAYNLGALQVLREEGVLERAEYVSAVSGGSYIASSFATVASRSPPVEGEPPVYAPGSPEEQHLRNNSSYMAPGAGGKVRLLLRMVLGMLVNLLVIGLAVYLIALPLSWGYGALYDQLATAEPASSTGLALEVWMWLIPALAAGLGVVFALPDLMKRLKSDARRGYLEAWSARLLWFGVLLALLLLAVPQVLLLVRGVDPAFLEGLGATLSGLAAPEGPDASGTGLLGLLNLGALLSAALGALGAFVARERLFFVLAAAAVAGPLALIIPFLWIVNAGAVEGLTADAALAMGIAAGAAIIVWLLLDLTQWSLHPFYRRRLSSAFFVERTAASDQSAGVREVDYEQALRLSTLWTSPRDFPTLVVCAAANVSDRGLTPPGRAASPFTFTREEIGGPLVKSMRTADYESDARKAGRADRAITLPAAVAMSGAAVSPAMGRKTIRALTFLMALTNVRLGVWVPNPQRVDSLAGSRFTPAGEADGPVARAARSAEAKVVRAGEQALNHVPSRSARGIGRWMARALGRRRPTPIYLFKEMFGRTSVDDRFIYVTDGGHYDNLGLLELLRRGCTTIFCLDAGGDPSGTYGALGEAVALARSDLQVDIEIDPAPIIPSDDRLAATDHVVGRFRYRATHGRPAAGARVDDQATEWVGQIVYCRAAVTDDAPWDVRAYHEREKRFPYHSTFDQLFTDEKFESYRALGAHTTRRAVATWFKAAVREQVLEVLRQTARRRETIRYEQLVERVREHMARAQLGSLRPLLEEIVAEEKACSRPPLAMVVQEAEPSESVRQELAQVYEYWIAIGVRGSTNGGDPASVASAVARAGLVTPANGQPAAAVAAGTPGGVGGAGRRRHWYFLWLR